MDQYLFDPGRLAKIQEEELAIAAQDPEIQQELEEDVAILEAECTAANEEEKSGDHRLRPEKFPEEYWHYVRNDQRLLVKERFEKFKIAEVLDELISDTLKKLSIEVKILESRNT